MDSPRTSRAGSRSRRKIFSCPVCDEVFIDEESLRRHELTHQNPEGGGEEGGGGDSPSSESEPPPAPEPATSGEDESPSAVQEAPAAPAPRARPLSSVRRQAAQAAQAQEAPPAQVEPEANFLPPTDSIEMPVDPDATVRVQHPHLRPMGWEGEAQKGGGGLGPLWKFIEDFSEWFVRGTTKTASTVGFSVLSGFGLALRALLILGMAAACLYAGTWVGRIYGHHGDDVPLPPPPTRTVANSGELNQQAVTDLVMGFYESISDKSYEDAYDALSPEWQRVMSLDKFRDGYAKTDNARCSVKSVRSIKGGYLVEIGLEVTESGKKHYYKGDYVAISTSKGWKLDQGNIR